MKDIIIVGAGGFGREAVDIINAINKVEMTWRIKGFIDDNLHALDNVRCKYSIIGTISEWIPSEDETFVMGVAAPSTKEKIVTKLLARGAKFTTLIHPAAQISEQAIIGNGCVIGGHSGIGDCAEIGDFVNVAGSMVGQDSVIGDFSTTTGFANIVSARLGKGVMVGSHAVILNKIQVGDYAVIGVGSIVVRNVKAGSKVFGYPAKTIDV